MRQRRTNPPPNRRLKTPFRRPTIGQMTFSMAQLFAESSSREADRGDIYIWSHRRADEAVRQPVRNLQASVRPTKHPVSQTGVHCEPAASSPQSATAPELCGLNGQSCGTGALGAQWGGYPGIQPFTGGLCAHGWTVQQWTHAAKALMAFGLCVRAAGTFRNPNRQGVTCKQMLLIIYYGRTFILKGKQSWWNIWCLNFLLGLPRSPALMPWMSPFLSPPPPTKKKTFAKNQEKVGCFSSSAPNLVLGYLSWFICPVPVQVTARPVYRLFLIICGITDGQTAGRGYKKEAEEAGCRMSKPLNPREDYKTRQNLAAERRWS